MKWKSNNWFLKGDTTAISSLTTCPYLLEGLRAYACRQARVFHDVHNHFLDVWKGLELPKEHLTEPAHLIGLDWDAMELDGDDA